MTDNIKEAVGEKYVKITSKGLAVFHWWTTKPIKKFIVNRWFVGWVTKTGIYTWSWSPIKLIFRIDDWSQK